MCEDLSYDKTLNIQQNKEQRKLSVRKCKEKKQKMKKKKTFRNKKNFLCRAELFSID